VLNLSGEIGRVKKLILRNILLKHTLYGIEMEDGFGTVHNKVDDITVRN